MITHESKMHRLNGLTHELKTHAFLAHESDARQKCIV